MRVCVQTQRAAVGHGTKKDGSMELECRDLTKRYGAVCALDHLSLRMTEGIYAVLGPNGAGKSTWMNLLTDNIRRTEGSILLDGTDILEWGRRYRDLVGYMPQQQGLYDSMSGRSFLYYMAWMKRIPHDRAREQTESLLRTVNLERYARQKIREYSGGMKQRLMLAQALLGDPRILLLDEPTAGLDPEERIRLWEYIRSLSRDRILILTTHIVTDVESVADVAVFLKQGRLAGMGTPAELIRREKEKGRSANLEDVYLSILKEDRG